MLRADYRYPIVAGDMLAAYRAGLTSWSSLTCQAKRPATMPKRLLTLRDDGGRDALGKSLTPFGVNVWADSAVDAANIALSAAAVTLGFPGAVDAVKAVRDIVGPYEVEDDPAFTFSGKTLTHYYFSFDAVIKAASL